MGSALLELCAIVGKEDREAAKYLKRHIVLVRQIGEKMRQPMTNTERLEWLQGCINGCRFVEHPVEKRVKETLISMLNQEIMVFRNKAQIYLEVYNTECARGGECIFGKVENLDRALEALYLTSIPAAEAVRRIKAGTAQDDAVEWAEKELREPGEYAERMVALLDAITAFWKMLPNGDPQKKTQSDTAMDGSRSLSSGPAAPTDGASTTS
jgi:hypothetical protein